MAEKINQELNVETELVEGRIGELSLMVDGEKILKKGWFKNPSEQDFVESARQAIA